MTLGRCISISLNVGRWKSGKKSMNKCAKNEEDEFSRSPYVPGERRE
jgi:hypothetical protein